MIQNEIMNLTQVNKNVFYKARIYAKEHNYRFIWFRNCKIFLRKEEKDKCHNNNYY